MFTERNNEAIANVVKRITMLVVGDVLGDLTVKYVVHPLKEKIRESKKEKS